MLAAMKLYAILRRNGWRAPPGHGEAAAARERDEPPRASEVGDELDYLAVADLEKEEPARTDLGDLDPAGPAASGLVHEDEHALVVELLVLIGPDAIALPGAEEVAEACRHLG